MRKQELVQLHVLGVLVRDRLENRYDLPPEPFGPYEEYGVEPTAIYRTKDAHREALLRLVDGLATAADRRTPEAD